MLLLCSPDPFPAIHPEVCVPGKISPSATLQHPCWGGCLPLPYPFQTWVPSKQHSLAHAQAFGEGCPLGTEGSCQPSHTSCKPLAERAGATRLPSDSQGSRRRRRLPRGHTRACVGGAGQSRDPPELPSRARGLQSGSDCPQGPAAPGGRDGGREAAPRRGQSQPPAPAPASRGVSFLRCRLVSGAAAVPSRPLLPLLLLPRPRSSPRSSHSWHSFSQSPGEALPGPARPGPQVSAPPRGSGERCAAGSGAAPREGGGGWARQQYQPAAVPLGRKWRSCRRDAARSALPGGGKPRRGFYFIGGGEGRAHKVLRKRRGPPPSENPALPP